MEHYTDKRRWNDETKAWEFDEPQDLCLSRSNALLAYLDKELQQARRDASDDKGTVYGKVRSGEAIAYANVIQWIKNVGR